MNVRFSIIIICFFLVFCLNIKAIDIDGIFTDWDYYDIKALDEYWGMTLGEAPSYDRCSPIDGGEVPPGDDWTYLFNDGWDDSRDIVAFYFRVGEEKVYFRIDFFDLKMYAEVSNGLDFYIICDFINGQGEHWLPDFVDCQSELGWDLAFCIYDSDNYSIKDGIPGQPELNYEIEGPKFNAMLDSVEFAVDKKVFTDKGWNPDMEIKFQVYTTKDGTNGGYGEIGENAPGEGNSDITDAIIDDDRGFSDGILNGYISSFAPPVGRAKWVVLMHGNQSFNNERQISARIDKSTDPVNPVQGVGLYRALETAEKTGMPVELHLSGTLTLASQWAMPSFNERIKRDVEAGLVDLVGGVFAEHIMTFFHGEVNLKSIELGTKVIQKIYGLSPDRLKVFWVPERVVRGDFTQDILDANNRYGFNYQAVVLDEFTTHHDWFGYCGFYSGIPGNETQRDMDDDVHKIHEYNGIKIFFIDRYAQKWKIETMFPTYYGCEYEPSLQIGLRAKLLDKAMDPDQAQVIVCMEDWEDYAGEPYRMQASRRNPDGHEIVTNWIANHQWILMTTTTKILNNEVDLDGDGIGDEWDTVVDEPILDCLPEDYGLPMPAYWYSDQLPLITYAWLRDSCEGNFGDDNPYPDPANVDNNPRNDDWDDGYQNWWVGSEWEWSFIDMVPALKGWQYDRSSDGSYPAVPLPNNKRMGTIWEWTGDHEVPGEEGIIPETWNRLKSTTASNELVDLAYYTYMAMIYESGWHDEYTVRHYTGDPDDDDTKGILVDWVLPACNHLRDVNMIVEAAQWADSNPSAQTIVQEKDVDLDGENEYILSNNKVFLIFENDGGRLVKAYSRDPQTGKVFEVVGASITHPDRGSEDEGLDKFVSNDPDPEINRVSCFRDQDYVNDVYLVNLIDKGLQFYSSDLKLKRKVVLPDDSDYLLVQYDVTNLRGKRNVEFGFSPNTLDLMFKGKKPLQEIGSPYDDFIGLENVNGGVVYLEFGDAEYVYRDLLERDVTMALTQRLVISIEGKANFKLGFGKSYRERPPKIKGVWLTDNPFYSNEKGELKIQAWVSGYDISSVKLYYGGTEENRETPPIYLLELKDDGTNGDEVAGDGVYTYSINLEANQVPIGKYLLIVKAENQYGFSSYSWPFLHVESESYYSKSESLLNFNYRGTINRFKKEVDFISKYLPYFKATNNDSPMIIFGSYFNTYISETEGGQLQLFVSIIDPDGISDINEVEIYYEGIPTGIYLEDIGNNFYGVIIDMPPGIPSGDYLLNVRAKDYSNNLSNDWPYWEVR